MSGVAIRTTEPMAVLRWFDLIVLALALPVFLLADFPMSGYAVAAGAWLIQRAVAYILTAKAAASTDARATVGLMAGSMIARGWFVAIAIFLVGILDKDKAGLAAAVLIIALFTIYFSTQMILRPFDTDPRKPAA
jgi:hypothetical protein